MEKLREKLIVAYKKGRLLETIYAESLKNEDKDIELTSIISKLHNDGLIDIIKEFRQLKRNMVKMDFFIIRHIFEITLPDLNAPVPLVMDCVRHLVSEAGNDMMAGSLFNPFIKYCEGDPNRPKDVLKISTTSSNDWLEFIAPAILAGATLALSEYASISIDLVTDSNKEVRIRAVFAIGKISYGNNTLLVLNAFKSLENQVQSEQGDDILNVILKASFSLYNSDITLENRLVNLFKHVVTYKEDAVLHAISEVYCFEAEKIPLTLYDVIVDALLSINPKNLITLRNIDYGIKYFMKSSLCDKQIAFIEQFLIQHEKFLSIKDLPTFGHYLGEGTHTQFNYLATRWLLSRKRPLCKAVMEVVKESHRDDFVLVADPDQFAKNIDTTCSFTARKAIGWLFMHPVSCASFIISLIEISRNDEIEQLSNLLFDPLLISYRGIIKRYIDSVFVVQKLKTQEALSRVLNRFEIYISGLNSASAIYELLPSQSHQESYTNFFTRQMKASFKETRRNSFMDLVTTSVLLYGRTSIEYHQDIKDNEKRIEIPLQSISHSVEVPMLNIIDPHGLDYKLRVFRNEGCEL